MATPAVVHSSVLVWGRESAGLSIEDAARLLQVRAERLASWERGEKAPTMGRVRRMADVYKRPLNVFFLSSPPSEPDAVHLPDFRTLPDDRSTEHSRPLRLALRRMVDWRSDALDLYRELGTAPPNFKTSVSLNANRERAAADLREAIELPLKEQISWSVSDRYRAFNTWRERIERLGVLVFQANRVPLEEMRGASRFEEPLPVILVNAADTPNGRTFTLLHELVHLALHVSGLCDPSRVRPASPRADVVEVFSNHVAGAILVPGEALLAHSIVARRRDQGWSDEEIELIADHFSVSRFVVLRRLLILGRVTSDFYELKHRQWSLQPRKSTEGGDGRRTNLSARGKTFSRLALAAYGAERITLFDTARYLGIKAPDLEMARAFASS
jgi:Zn-dependent peptidase ImmA (M78 family)